MIGIIFEAYSASYMVYNAEAYLEAEIKMNR